MSQAVAVLSNTKRKVVSRRVIEDTARQIVELFDPEQIILFGSYAYGTPDADSDVDLLVVMKTALTDTQQAIRICQAIPYRYGLDLLVRTPENLSRRIAMGDRFLQEVTNRGKVIYERPDP